MVYEPDAKYFRKQIDVLIANVPVGQVPVTVGEKLVQVSCHTRELSLPYYVLLMGTRGEVHTSMTTRYKQDDHTRMMELPDLSIVMFCRIDVYRLKDRVLIKDTQTNCKSLR